MQHRKLITATASTLSLAGLLSACATDNVDLGGGASVEQDLERGARCVESTIVEGDVFVADRAELEALRGCEAIRGDLTLMVFETPDLSALASLREVSGSLVLGATAQPIRDDILITPRNDQLEPALEVQAAEEAQSAAILEAGWLESLHGLEGLELTGALTVIGVAAPDLTVFANLRSVSNHPLPNEAGGLSIRQAPNLVDLRGLEGVRGIRNLRVEANPALQSLAGVELSAQMETVILGSNPRLTDLSALGAIDTLRSLAISDSGITDLDGLARLTFCEYVTLLANPELEDVSALSRLTVASGMTFLGNPALTSLPEFGELLSSIEVFRVIDNAALRSVSLNFPLVPITTAPFEVTSPLEGEQEPPASLDNLGTGTASFEFSDNPELESLSFAGHLTSALVLEVNRNAALSSLELGTLRSLNVLSITGNVSLSEVGLGDIQTINWISVVDNPKLSVAELGTVSSFGLKARGNADDAGAAD